MKILNIFPYDYEGERANHMLANGWSWKKGGSNFGKLEKGGLVKKGGL